MNRVELEEEIRSTLSKNHTPEEWKEKYQFLAEDSLQFHLLTEQLEDVLEAKYGEKALQEDIQAASQKYAALIEELMDQQKITPEEEQELSELFDLED